MHEQQMRSNCFDYHQPSQRSLSAGSLPASQAWHPNTASPSPTSWTSIALQQLALRSMQGCAAHQLASALNAAAAAPKPPAFDPALLRQLCGPAGVGVNAGPPLAPGLAPGLPLGPLQPAYAGAASFGGFARGAWGL